MVIKLSVVEQKLPLGTRYVLSVIMSLLLAHCTFPSKTKKSLLISSRVENLHRLFDYRGYLLDSMQVCTLEGVTAKSRIEWLWTSTIGNCLTKLSV